MAFNIRIPFGSISNIRIPLGGIWGGVGWGGGIPRTFRGGLKADINGGGWGGGAPPRNMFGFTSPSGDLKPNMGVCVCGGL